MRITGNSAPVTNSGDISQATLLAGPMDIRPTDISMSTIVAKVTGATAAGTVQLYGVIGAPLAESQGPSGLAWDTTSLTPVGNAITFTGAGQTAWDIGGTGFSALYVGWTKTGASAGTLSVLWNAK